MLLCSTSGKKSVSAPAMANCNPDELIEIDIAVDPCEKANLVAYGQNGSMAVLAIAEKVAYSQRLTFI